MRTSKILILLLISAFLLAACANQPTPEPTEEPTEEVIATEAATEEVVAEEATAEATDEMVAEEATAEATDEMVAEEATAEATEEMVAEEATAEATDEMVAEEATAEATDEMVAEEATAEATDEMMPEEATAEATEMVAEEATAEATDEMVAEEATAEATDEMMPEEATAEATDEMAAETPSTTRLILATTTSTYDSGLLDFIIPDFEAKTGYNVDIVAVGTGQAIALGESGDADVLLVHARAREDAFVEAGYGTARSDVMYNDFVILGPADDPAGIAGGTDAAAAFTAIADAEATFISRGDDSGTHTKERAIWESAGITPEGSWYQSAGQGMGTVLTMADEQQAYTLSDRGTYIARTAQGIDLVVLVEGDPILANPYGVIPVNPEMHPTVNIAGAEAFVTWLTSPETQELIASYQVNGQELFFPDSEAYHASQATMEEATAEATEAMAMEEATAEATEAMAMEEATAEATEAVD